MASETRPITIDASLISDTQAIVTGGSERGVMLNSKADLSISFDGEDASLPWLSAYFDVAVFQNAGMSGDAVGDIQGPSNVAFARSLRIINAWASVASGAFTVKAGLVDANVDFDEQNVGAIFIHASHGMGPDLSSSGLNGPSVSPNTTMGAVAAVSDVATGLKFRVGLFDGKANDPDRPARMTFDFGEGILAIAEADRTRPNGRLAVGAWHYTTRMPVLGSDQASTGSSGAFMIVEQKLVANTDGFDLDAWLRVGAASRRHNPITMYVGGGLVARSFWTRFPDDSIGLAIARAGVNPRLGMELGNETAIEATFQHKLTPWLFAQPDVQYIINPGGQHDAPDALLVGLRLIILQSVL